jgi:hypothetical protein
MATSFKTLYPVSNADTVAITISLNSLATSSTLVAGRESTAVDNRTNLDLDHLVSGKVKLGTSPTVSTFIEVWAHAPISIASGTPTYADVLTGADAAATITSVNVKQSMFRLLWSTIVDATTGRVFYMPPTSIALAFGAMPPYWGLWLTHSTAVNLDASAGGSFNYHRIQQQGV